MSDLILAIDPSSKRTGWAVMTMGGQLREAGIITPAKQSAASQYRIASMREDLQTLLEEVRPTIVLIEYVSSHVGRRRHQGEGSGLAVYGCAVGVTWQAVEDWKHTLPAERQSRTLIHLIDPDVWTAGVEKEQRQLAVASEYPTYDPKVDPGGDIADAIGLGVWFQRERIAMMLKGAAS